MVKEKTIIIKFVGIDSWNRPVYKDVNTTIYYGSVHTLFPNKNIAPNNTPAEINEYFKKNIEELEYFGVQFDCEPNGGMPAHYKLVIET